MKGSTYNMLTAAVFAALLALSAGVVQAAASNPSAGQTGILPTEVARTTTVHCDTRAIDGPRAGERLASHLIRDGQGCIVWP